MKKNYIYTIALLVFLKTSVWSQTVFSENIGTPTTTTTIDANSFQNSSSFSFSNGQQANAADIRNTSASSNYSGASGGGNVYFTATSGAYGFSVEGINASNSNSLSLQFGYRKESASALPSFSVDYWNGTSWITIANTASALFNETTTAPIAWYLSKTLSLPADAQINGLKIRFVKTGTVAIRIDDINLSGAETLPTNKTILSENMGTPTATTAIPANTFQNISSLLFSNGAQTNAADVRNTSASSSYSTASGGGNVYFTATSGNYGFSVEGIDASNYNSLSLQFGYRKESATALASFSVDYWNGTSWITVANTPSALFNETATAPVAWYMSKTLLLPADAQINGLKIRFVKTGTVGIRIDDLKLSGAETPPTNTILPQTISSENMGTPTGTTAINANTFQNTNTLTFSNGDQVNAADVRNSSASTGYSGASGDGNVYFSSISGAYGFSIEGINASKYNSLSLQFAYRKESTSALPSFSVDYWNGTSWITVANTASDLFKEATTSPAVWYLSKIVSLPAEAQINGLKIRFVKTGTVAIRIDDVRLSGIETLTTINNSVVTNITANSATFGGTLVTSGGPATTTVGTVYSNTLVNANPTIEGLGVTMTTASPNSETGSFTINSGAVLSANVQYSYNVFATKTTGTTEYGTAATFYTFAVTPAAPIVTALSASELNLAIGNDSNSAITTYAIMETNSGNYIQSDGTLGTAKLFQTKAAWSTITVTELTAGTTYTFEVIAKNGAGIITANSPSASAVTLLTPTFDPISVISTGNIISQLPTTSTNGIVGSWSLISVSDDDIYTYKFTPNGGQNTFSVTISFSVFASKTLKANDGEIGIYCDGLVGNVYGLATINGQKTVTKYNASISTNFPENGSSPLSINSDGRIVVPYGTQDGHYKIKYKMWLKDCEANYSIATHTVNVTCHLERKAHKEINKEVVIYPNPSNSLFNIDLTYVDEGYNRVKVFNINGALIYQGVLNPGEVNPIDLSGVQTGSYFAQISNNTNSKTLTLIKK